MLSRVKFEAGFILGQRRAVRDSTSAILRCRPEFRKRRQLFIGTHNKASGVFALCGGNPLRLFQRQYP